MEITVEYSESGLFGGTDSETMEGYDVSASVAKYGELLEQKLQAEFTGAEIVVKRSIHDRVQVDSRFEHDADVVRHIESQVYEEFAWIVEK